MKTRFLLALEAISPTRSCSMISLIALVILLPVSLRADGVVTFFDGTETLSVEMSDPSRMSQPSFLPCGVLPGGDEACGVIISAPAEAVFANLSTSFAAVLLISDPDGLVSDSIFPSILFLPGGIGIARQVELDFHSDSESLLGLFGSHTCSEFANPCMLEDGTVQTAGTITWVDATGGVVAVDTIKFQSDVETPVPEPSSIMLLLTGFAGLGFTKLRNKIARPTSRAS